MRRCCLWIVIAIALLIPNAVSQNNREGGRRRRRTEASAEATASISVSGSSIEELQESLQQQAEEAFTQLTDNPDDLNTLVTDLASALAQAMAELMIAFLQDGTGSASAQAGQISEAISAALGGAADTVGGDLADLDVAGIQDSIEASVEEILGDTDDDVDLATLTQQVANSVVSIVGEAVGDALGVTFTASVEVTTETTPAEITLTPGPPSNGAGSADVNALIAAQDVEGLVIALSLVLSTGNTDAVADAIVAALPDALGTLNETFTIIFQNASFPIWPLATAIGQAYRDDVRNIPILLGQSIAASNDQETAPGLARALSFALATGGPALSAFDAGLSAAIREDGCSAVANVLAQAQAESQRQGVVAGFLRTVQNNPEIAECLRVGVQLEITVGILTLLDNPQEAALEIAANIQQGNFEAISNLIIEAISNDRTDDLVNSLSVLLSNGTIDVTNLTFAFNLAFRTGGDDVQQALTQTFIQAAEDGNTALLIPSIQFAFSTASRNITNLYISIIIGAIEDGDCGPLQDVVSTALDTAEGDQRNAILQTILGNPDLSPCVEESLLTASPVDPVPADDEPILDPTPTTTPEPLPESTSTTTTTSDAGVFRYDFRGSRVMVGSCFDITPPGGLTCEQQQEFGKCARNWMLKGGFCAATCGYCEDDCIEIQPTEAVTCAMELREGNCDNILQDGFCRRTCGGNCPDDVVSETVDGSLVEEAAEIVDPTEPARATVIETGDEEEGEQEICDDIVPDDMYTCEQQKEFEKCDAAWMIAGDYCRKTCGRCVDVTSQEDRVVEEVTSIVNGAVQGQCECACAEPNAELIAQIVSDAVAEVMKEMNLTQK